MKTAFCFFFISFILSTLLSAQGEADIWVLGADLAGDPNDTIYGTTLCDFRNEPPTFTYHPELNLDLRRTNAMVSDRTGNLLFYSNGMEINSDKDIRISDTIAFAGDGEYWLGNYYEQGMVSLGFPIVQGAIILPLPGSEDVYSLIYHNAIYNPLGYYAPYQLLEARIQRVGQEYDLIYQDSIILEHKYLGFGKFSACRHANGRDWWIYIIDADSPNYFRFLLDPQGIQFEAIQNVGESHLDGAGQTWFSPDGDYYVRYEGITFEDDYILSIYSFNRCSGEISLIEQIMVGHNKLSALGGMCFSQNSRYLYANTNFELFQWDLLSEDIAASKIRVDTFDGFVEPNWFITQFSYMQLAPDGRIYMNVLSGNSRYMHVIDRPNEKGEKSKLKQHSLKLPTWNSRSTPNFANYRLGPLDGSPCDTLGLDNHPVAKWRFEPDEEEQPKTIRFTDLSFFRPETWHWDFDDGNTSSEQHPIHSYQQSGLYEVCLTVSNEYASDTSCQWVEVVSTSVTDQQAIGDFIEVGPNPFSAEIRIKPQKSYRNFRITLLDIHGRQLMQTEMPCHCSIRTEHLPPGIYFYTLEEDQQLIQSGKLVKGE